MKRLPFLIALILLLTAFAVPAGAESETAAITAENTWTDGITPKNVKSASGGSDALLADYGTLNLSITGTWVGTVTLQKAYDFGTAWLTTNETWTANATKVITCYEPGTSFRLGIATGDFTSGTCNVRLSK